MKSVIVASALFIATSWSAFGRAYFYSKTELIQKATAIAIVEIEAPKPTSVDQQDPFADDSATGKNWTYRQQAKVRVEKILKGELPKEFILYGRDHLFAPNVS